MSKCVSMAVILCAVALSFTLTSVAIGQTKPPPLRIGTFDSRAVALAFWNSEEGKKQIASVHEKYAKAKAAKDEKRMKQLEHEGPGLQVRMHQQAFSTGSVIRTILEPLPSAAVARGGWGRPKHRTVNRLRASVDFTDAGRCILPITAACAT